MTPQQIAITDQITTLSAATGADTADLARVIYDALDHYLDTLVVDVNEGHEPAKADMVLVEALLAPEVWVDTAAAA